MGLKNVGFSVLFFFIDLMEVLQNNEISKTALANTKIMGTGRQNGNTTVLVFRCHDWG